jgi:hypothetical protein
VTVSAQSIKKSKRQRAVSTLETKFKIIADYEAWKRVVISIVVEADIWCYKEVITEMKKARIRPTAVSRRDRWFTALNFYTFSFFNKIIQLLNIFLKFYSKHICMYEICVYLINCN